MRRPITYAELLLLFILLPGYIGVNHLYEFVSDRITIEVLLKNKMGGSKPTPPTIIMPEESNPQAFQTIIPQKSYKDLAESDASH